MSATEIVAICLQFIDILNQLKIPYSMGGSMASSLQGAPRSTKNADIIVDIQPSQLPTFIHAVEPIFLINSDVIAKAVNEKRTFNLLHLETMLKVDVFPVRNEPYWRTEFSRREQVKFTADDTLIWCTSAEDIILKKLHWFRKGGDVSERQWQDILEVFRVHSSRLDIKYMDTWAEQLNVSDQLAKAKAQNS